MSDSEWKDVHTGLAIAILSLAALSAVHAESAYKLADGKVKNSPEEGDEKPTSDDCQTAMLPICSHCRMAICSSPTMQASTARRWE